MSAMTRRRISPMFVVFALVVTLAGCEGKPPGTTEAPSFSSVAHAPSSPVAPAPEVKEEYDTHYAQGLVLMADNKYDDALAEFQKAQAISNTIEVAAQIEKIKRLTVGDEEAKQILKEVETLRQAGKLDEASKRAAEGIEKYWSTPSAPALADLKKAIDADIARQIADKQAYAEKVYQQALENYRQGNLRNAYLSLSEATKYSQDPRIAALYEDAKARITLYDESLQAADAYMKNPDTYEDAIASLEAAQKVWDTPEVRTRLQAAHEALKTRRERIAVIDFETKGEFDVPNAGRIVAELLLPRFQNKYDLIERTHLAKLLQEQNLQMSDLVAPDAVEMLSRIKRVQYLVTGSITRFGHVRITARLIQVTSGLIESTAQVTPPNIHEIDLYLDDLAAQLTMTPEEYRAYQARRAPPAPIIGYIPLAQAAPLFEGFTQTDIEYVDEGAPLALEPPTSWREEQFKREMYDNLISLGQEFMAKRQFYEASRQFEMALLVYPGDPRTIGLLSEAYRRMSYTPPPPSPPRDRVAVLDFVALGNPGYPYAGQEVADLLASYLSRRFDVVDRGELFWHMKRMRVTMRQLLHSRQRLMWFGRIFNIRYFIIGYLVPSHSFDVIANLVDAQDGIVQSRARIHVYNAYDLRYRIPDLSHAIFLGHHERRAWLEECNRRYELFRNGQNCMRENKFAAAMKIFGELMNLLQPDRHHFYLAESRRCFQQAQLQERLMRPRQPIIVIATDLRNLEREREEARRRAEETRRQQERNYRAAMEEGHAAMAAGDYAAAMRAFAAAMNLRKTDEAEDAYRAAKKRAEQQKALWEADSRTAHRYRTFMETGRKLLLLARYAEAIKSFESALAVKRTPEALDALADAKRRLEEFNRQQQAAAADRERREAERIAHLYDTYIKAARGDIQRRAWTSAVTNFTRALALKKTPEAESGLQEAQQRLAEEQRERQPQPAQKPRLEEPRKPTPRDLAYERLMKEGRDLMAKQEFARAVRSFAQAFSLKKSDEARAAYDEAVKKNEEAQAVAAEARRAKQAELEAKRAAEEQARKALEKAKEEAEQRKPPEERKHPPRETLVDKQYADALADGQRNMEAKKFDQAARDFTRALRYKQTPEAQALLKQAQDAAAAEEQSKKAERDRLLKEKQDKAEPERKAKEEAEKRAADQKAKLLDQAYQRHMDMGQANMQRKRFDAAMKNFADALHLKKTDEAQAAYDQAKAALDAAKAEEEAKLRKKKDAEDAARRPQRDEQEANRAAEEQARKQREQSKEEPKPSARKPRIEEKPTQPQPKRDEERAKPQSDARAAQIEVAYQRYMKLGSQYMERNLFAQAARAFEAALKLKSTDEAKAALEAAQQKLKEQKEKPPAGEDKAQPRKHK